MGVRELFEANLKLWKMNRNLWILQVVVDALLTVAVLLLALK